MTGFEKLKSDLNALGLHYLIEEQVCRKDGSLYEFASIRAPLPLGDQITKHYEVRTVALINDQGFDIWLLGKTPMLIEGVVDQIAATLAGTALMDDDLPASLSDDWTELATRQGDEWLKAPSRHWLSAHTIKEAA